MKKYFQKNIKESFIYLIVCLLAALSSVGLAFLYQEITATVLSGNLQRFFKIVLFACFYIGFEGWMDYKPREKRGALLQHLMVTIRRDVIKKISSLPIADFEKEGASGYTSKMINDLKIIEEEYLQPMLSLILSLCFFISALVSALYIETTFTILILCLVLIPLSFPYFSKKILSGKKEKITEKQKNYLLQLEDILQHFRPLRFYDSFKGINRKHEVASQAVGRSKHDFVKAQSSIYAISYSLGNIVYLGTWLVGGFFVLKDKLSFPALIAMTNLMSMIAGPIQNFSDSYTEILASQKIVDKLLTFLNTAEEQTGKQKIATIKQIECKNVELIINDHTLLTDFNYIFRAGEKYGIVGESGSGKSTLFQLLLGLRQPTHGEILINGIPLTQLDLVDYYAKLGIVEQKTAIFNDSFAENVTLFHHIPEETIVAKAKQGGLEKWLEQQDNQLATHLGEKGQHLSGGEERRLDLVRALLKAPSVYLLDEPTTGLDQQNAEFIQQQLLALPADLLIVVTHSQDADFLASFDHILSLTP